MNRALQAIVARIKRHWVAFVTICTTIYFIVAIVILTALRDYLVSDIAGTGQLAIDILLLPTVLIGFIIAIYEFRKSQVKPDLKLFWVGDMAVIPEDDFLVLETSKHNNKVFSLRLFAKNDGESIATWYRIIFDIPSELSRPLSDSHLVQWHQGDQDSGKSYVSTVTTHYVFKSNGQYALYPGEETHIATLTLQLFPQVHYPSRAGILYSVVTEKTRLRYGVCKLKMRPEFSAY